MTTDAFPNVWVVRADGGRFTDACVRGGFTGIGWNEVGDLSEFSDREALKQRFEASFPEHSGQARGNVERFRFDIMQGDYVVTPASDSNLLHYGRVIDDQIQFVPDVPNPTDDCRYAHRRSVDWEKPLKRLELSAPLQRSLRPALTVFQVTQWRDFLTTIGVLKESETAAPRYDPYQSVLKSILKLNEDEFEYLVADLLKAMGFEAEVVGGVGDGGVDVRATLSYTGLIDLELFVQAKLYGPGRKVSITDVRKLRQVIPNGGQGAVITTADYAENSYRAASESGFARIGLINGRKLVELLVEYWDSISEEFQDKLGIRPGLVPA